MPYEKEKSSQFGSAASQSSPFYPGPSLLLGKHDLLQFLFKLMIWTASSSGKLDLLVGQKDWSTQEIDLSGRLLIVRMEVKPESLKVLDLSQRRALPNPSDDVVRNLAVVVQRIFLRTLNTLPAMVAVTVMNMEAQMIVDSEFQMKIPEPCAFCERGEGFCREV